MVMKMKRQFVNIKFIDSLENYQKKTNYHNILFIISLPPTFSEFQHSVGFSLKLFLTFGPTWVYKKFRVRLNGISSILHIINY